MFRLTELLRGDLSAELEGADAAPFFNRCTARGIVFQKAKPLDDFTLLLRFRRRELEAVRAAAENSGCTLRVTRERGLPAAARGLRGRWALCVGSLLCALALLWSSLHVWEIELRGAESVGGPALLAALDEAGVGVGSFWPAFVNERIKCRVLYALPELSWAAVQVRGSRAVALVREAVPPPEVCDIHEATEIVAGKAGLVTEVRALRGEATVKPGQTVLAGETLVSAQVHSSFEKADVRLVHAVAEVYARTWYSLSACAPLSLTEKRPSGREKLRLALELGGRRINIYDNSGNPAGEYDKITKTYRLAVSGKFFLPLALTVERLRFFDPAELPQDRDALRAQLEESLLLRLRQEIGETGEIRESAFSVSEQDGMLYVTLRAECLEDIARERKLTEE